MRFFRGKLGQVKSDDWQTVKSLRLRAIADAPYAFAETLSEVEAMPDSMWQMRTQQNSEGICSIGILAFDINYPVGMAIGLLDSNDSSKVHLVAMWVSPEQRGTGLAKSLVCAIQNWAQKRKATTIVGEVTEHNLRGQAFYKKIGFKFLPFKRPWALDPSKNEIPMQKII